MKRTNEQRFWAKVKKTSGCWIWQGKANWTGYGALSWRGKDKSAHRASYEIAHGDIPAGALVLHKCDNRLCVRPDHLFLGTQRDNVLDAIKKGRFNPPDISQWQRYGEDINTAKLTEAQVREIRQRHAEGETPKYLASVYGVHWSSIYGIVRRKTWKQVA